MTVRELRAALFLIKDQEAEVRFHDPLNAATMRVASVWVANTAALDVPPDAEPIFFDTIVPCNLVFLNWADPK